MIPTDLLLLILWNASLVFAGFFVMAVAAIMLPFGKEPSVLPTFLLGQMTFATAAYGYWRARK